MVIPHRAVRVINDGEKHIEKNEEADKYVEHKEDGTYVVLQSNLFANILKIEPYVGCALAMAAKSKSPSMALRRVKLKRNKGENL